MLRRHWRDPAEVAARIRGQRLRSLDLRRARFALISLTGIRDRPLNQRRPAHFVGAAGRSSARWSSIQASMRSHQANSHSIWASRSGGDLGAGHLPPLHQQPLVHRQLAPHVADGEHVVHARCGRPSPRRRRARRPARPGSRRVAAPARWSSPRPARPSGACPSLCSRSIARSRRRGVKLPPSGKITKASFSSRPVASSAICVLELARRPPGVGRDEPCRDAVQDHVDRGVPGQGVLEHHARLAVVPVHQRVDQHERVARPRVPAADQQRLARDGRRAPARRSRWSG